MTLTHEAASSAWHGATRRGPLLAEGGQYLTFSLGAEEYGIDIRCVQEIRGYAAPTRITSAADFVLGVVNLRGAIVPVVDLRRKLGLPHAKYDSATVTIVVSTGAQITGAVVDSVSDVLTVPADCIKPAPCLSTGVRPEQITGIGTVPRTDAPSAERMLILLDIERVLLGVDRTVTDFAAQSD